MSSLQTNYLNQGIDRTLMAKQTITSILKPKKTYMALKKKSAKKIGTFVAWLTLSLSCQAHAMTASMNGLRSFKTVYRGVKMLLSNNTTIGLYGELIDGPFSKFMFIVIKIFTCKDKNERINQFPYLYVICNTLLLKKIAWFIKSLHW